MRERLTKAQVEVLVAHLDGSADDLVWVLATELDEDRRLAPG